MIFKIFFNTQPVSHGLTADMHDLNARFRSFLSSMTCLKALGNGTNGFVVTNLILNGNTISISNGDTVRKS